MVEISLGGRVSYISYENDVYCSTGCRLLQIGLQKYLGIYLFDSYLKIYPAEFKLCVKNKCVCAYQNIKMDS